MQDLANLAEHLNQQLAREALGIRQQLQDVSETIINATNKTASPPATVAAMQQALSELPYFGQMIQMMELLDQELTVNPGPITPERIVPIAYKCLILKR